MLGIPAWAVLLILIATAIGGFALGAQIERALGRPLSAEKLNGAEDREIIEQIEIVNLRTG